MNPVIQMLVTLLAVSVCGGFGLGTFLWVQKQVEKREAQTRKDHVHPLG